MANSAPSLHPRVVTDHAGNCSDRRGFGPPDSQLVGRVWLPLSEQHLVEMMTTGAVREVNGRLTYQYRKLEYAMKHVTQRRCAVDVGAHVGLWSMHLADLFETVRAFEPNPVTADVWRWNVPNPNATLERCALGNRSGAVGLALQEGHTGHTRIDGDGPIPIETLDSFDLKDVDLIKIDVEGYELDVVKGAEQTLRRCRPVVVVEQKGEDGRLGMEPDGALHWLERLGMRSEFCIGGDHFMVWE